ncbi:MAG: phage tail tape measure protein [Vampirovibrio sp.]
MSNMKAVVQLEANASGLEKGLKTAQNAINATSKGVDALNKQFKSADSTIKALKGFDKTKQSLVSLQKGIGTTKDKLKEFQSVYNKSGQLDATAKSQMEHFSSILKTQEGQHRRLAKTMGRYKQELKETGVYSKALATSEERMTSVLRQQEAVRTRLGSKISMGGKWNSVMNSLPLTAMIGGNPMLGGAGMLASTFLGGGAGLATMGALGLGAGAMGMFNGAEGQAYRSKDTALRLMQNTGGFSDSMRGTISEALLRTSSMSLMQEPQLIDALQVLIANGVQTQTALAMLPTLAKASKGSGTDPLDMANLATALSIHMGVKPQYMGKALDVLSTAGKLGSFELNNMAQFMPKLGAWFKVMNLDESDLPSVGAMLQVAKKGAGSPEEAANNMYNFMGKIYSGETLKHFKDKKVDIPDLMKNPQKYYPKVSSGIEALIMKISELTKKGKDLKALSFLFGDAQVKNFLIPMITNWTEYEEIKKKSSKDSAGAIDRDFKNVLSSSEMATQKMGASYHLFATQALKYISPVGTALALMASNALTTLAALLGSEEAKKQEQDRYDKAYGKGKYAPDYIPSKGVPKPKKFKDWLKPDAPLNYDDAQSHHAPKSPVLPTVIPLYKPIKTASAGGGGTVVVQVASLPSRQQLTAFMDMAKNATQGTMSDMPEYA